MQGQHCDVRAARHYLLLSSDFVFMNGCDSRVIGRISQECALAEMLASHQAL